MKTTTAAVDAPDACIPQSKRSLAHWGSLLGVLAIAALLRFWSLASKPLWLDEIATALFGFGRGYNDIPIDTLFDPAQLPELLRWQAGVSCPEIGALLAEQSTHPPLFFCSLYGWLAGADLTSVWQLRALPAFLGVVAVGAVYGLGRLAFSPQAGLWAAVVMAVSPFGMYLSQEARQYTLLSILVAVAVGCTISLTSVRTRQGWWQIPLWLLWAGVNSFGCYVHYFFAIVLAAQLAILLVASWRRPDRLLSLCLATVAIVMSYWPWLPVAIAHFSSPKTSWLPEPQGLTPLVQLLVSWVVTIAFLPVEKQSLPIKIVSALAMLAAVAFVCWTAIRQWRQAWPQWLPWQQRNGAILVGFVGLAITQFLGIVYILGKDITVAPRYNYAYFPVFCILLGIVLALPSQAARRSRWVVVAVGVASALCINANLVFKKPFLPGLVAEQLNASKAPLLVAVAADDSLELALGVSYLLALNDRRDPALVTQAVFLDRSNNYGQVWQRFASLDTEAADLWAVAPHLRRVDFPDTLQLGSDRTCEIDPDGHYRIGGYPYQHYRCRTQATKTFR
ncbi:MAG: glycosyltransferase family 39 protein [Cyanobacteria bacterium J06641_5]